MKREQFELSGLHDEHRDRAVLVAVDHARHGWPIDESLAELARLAHTAGCDVVGTVTQKLDHPHTRSFVGPGKAQEIADLAREMQANTVIFDDDLSPSQQVNIEDLIDRARILDRTALILEIFAQHAESREGKLQVELARMEYVLPRLRGMWGHLEAERLGGGRGARFGAGESQLEVDRRLTRRRISDLKKDLKQVAANRQVQRHQRAASGVFRVSLVGYTNAGKSTLLNALTGAGTLVQDQLFATLDSTTRKLELPEGREITLTDTVGFIHKLPHGLVEAFKSTLDEVREADLLMHVIDGSHPQAEAQANAVDVVLSEIEAHRKPRLLVVNKCDVMTAEDMNSMTRRHPDAVFISAFTCEGLEELLARIAKEASRGSRLMTVLIPYVRGELVQLAHERTQVISERHTGEGTGLVLSVPSEFVSRFEPYLSPAEDGVGPESHDAPTGR